MLDNNLTESIDRITAQYTAIQSELERVWAKQIVFTLHWRIDLGLTVLPWILWLIILVRRMVHAESKFSFSQT